MNTVISKMALKSCALLLGAGIILALPSLPTRAAGGTGHEVERQSWSFGGLLGGYDRAQLRRGYQIYKDVCAGCHSMNLLAYRNLVQPGGPQMSAESVKELIADVEVQEGVDGEGEPIMRGARLADKFPAPYNSNAEAEAANGGALPPDLSVMAKARTIHRATPWFLEPVNWIYDIVTGYEEKGADYLYALLTGYHEPPEGFELAEGMNYNTYFPGNQIAMAQPLFEEAVEYEDGTKPTLENHARDVTAFLMWAAEPTLEERKRMGLTVMIFLIIMAGLAYLAKRACWSDLKH